MTEKVFFHLYRRVLIPIVWLVFNFLSRFQPEKKWSYFFKDRRKPEFKSKTSSRPASRPLWIHAASGEIEYARPLLRKLKANYPELPLLVTSTSRSSRFLLESIPEIDFWGPSPWDSIQKTKSFLDEWQPRALLIARTDLWPELLYQCEKRNIPRILFSATFNFVKAPSLFQKFKIMNLQRLSKIFAVSEQDHAQLRMLGLKAATVGGDTRYDQVFHRLENPKKLNEKLRPSPEEFVFVAGSTWPEDEAHIIPALSKEIRVILAPHEIHEEHLTKLEHLLKEKNLSSQRYSQASQWEPSEVLIVDQVGILAEIYTWGSVAFVGGSFKRQVHSVMEPLAAGLPTLVGPFHANNREAIEFQSHFLGPCRFATQVNDSHEIREELFKLKSNYTPETKKLIQAEVRKKTGATQAMLKYLSAFINRPSH